MDNFQKLIFGSQGAVKRKEPVIKYYIGREVNEYDLLKPPIVDQYNPYSSTHYQMSAEDNMSPLDLSLGLYDPDKMVKSANLYIYDINGGVTTIPNLTVDRLTTLYKEADTIIRVHGLNNNFDTQNNPQPEFSVILEIILKNGKKITLDEKYFMRYKLSGPGSDITRYRDNRSYTVFEFTLYIDGTMSYPIHADEGCKFGFQVINSPTTDRIPVAIIEAVDVGTNWSITQNTTEMTKLNFRSIMPETLPADKVASMRLRISLYDPRNNGGTATVEVYAIRQNTVLRQFAVNDMFGK